ncbi:uncharacterized protein ARMOST_06279 [Armillaria ostoyae]|uniref:CCHC-type domain-containing protein n=1 Tax=Armillaria ostoyae TaxID=47428 RepID=A0A284R2K9_ARMOS|nr:uncharacterized protein ARMOST_06279 [Armillaria ostoyae]
MIRPPVPFEGKYDDIERFIGDCCMYFEASPKTGGSTSDKNSEFVGLISRQFHDPATQDIHKKRMFDLRMGKGPAISYFNELEIEAKKAGRREDDQERGLMVKAVRLGVPDLYTNAIASSGEHVPSTYNEWKRRILRIYEERQKKWVFDQTVGGRSSNPPKTHTAPSTGTTATSHNKTGGTTSSSSGKPTSSAPNTGGHDASGRWLTRTGTTYGGQGTPMDIGQMRAKGLCFRCHKQGHLGKDCPEKKDFRDIRSVQATTEPATGSKVKEIAKDLLTGARLSSAGRSHGLFVGTSSNPTCIIKCTNIFSTSPHLNIPRLRAPAFNVSSTTSTPVSESQNRYAALSVEECNDNDNDITSSALDAEAEQRAESPTTRPLLTLGQTDANHRASSLCGETQSTNASGEKSTLAVTPIDIVSLPRMTDGTKGSSKGSPDEGSSRHEQAAQTLGSTTPKVDVESQLGGETTARLPGQERVPHGTSASPDDQVYLPEVGVEREPQRAGVTGTAVSSRVTTQVRPVALSEGDTPVREPSSQATKGGTLFDAPMARQEERLSKAAGDANATATKKIAAGLEAASAQAVNRGHPTTMIKVPDEDDDTAYQIWLAKERLPTIVEKGDEPSSVPPTKSDSSRWYKPFEVDWTLRAVREA